MEINPLMFREYDIRGIAGKDLTAELVRALGLTFARHVSRERAAEGGGAEGEGLRIVVGRDGRLSSPELARAMAEGLAQGGAEVLDGGLIPSPGLYFANHHFQAAAAVMLTGSHNPPEYNGLKMVRGNKPVYGAEIQALRRQLEAGDAPAAAPGTIRQVEVIPAYLDRLTEGFRPGRRVRVVVDCGNGVTGVVAPELFRRLPGIDAEVIFAEVDGTFPNHHPDPTEAKNLVDLRRRMVETGAELGIAFDGDGDRIGALDETGGILWGDRMMVLFARSILAERPGGMVIGDVKCSQLLFDAVARAGGVPLMWKTGHSLVKAKMRETGAMLAGEMSGHLFFADRYLGYDDALYAAVRLLELTASQPGPLSPRLGDLPVVYSTPELRLFCPDERKFGVMERVAARLRASGAELSDVDGVRVREGEGWWLLRVSNTQPAMVARVEAASREGLHAMVDNLARLLAEEGVTLPEWEEA
ncbi:MAG: phosphomannomutase/phosphoglucomutase [Magnetococcales bacterium]|nr:phosphomannomutase/phosphoglucomutase [Magnetococcales bacterium]